MTPSRAWFRGDHHPVDGELGGYGGGGGGGSGGGPDDDIPF